MTREFDYYLQGNGSAGVKTKHGFLEKL